ncbi:MAG TPA: FAD:protein FMN transferase [Acidothermaceae bacterium]|jgi:thiamine biosynthesis lipoprotein
MNTGKPSACEWSAIGTTVRVVVSSPDRLFSARRIVVEEVQALDLACSRFRPDSEVARLAVNAGRWTPISGLLADVLECALAVARDTDGDVDPTMGADLGRLGYDRDFGQIVHLPAGSTSSAAVPLSYRLVRRPTWRDVELDRAGRRVRAPAGVVIDLGAIAKASCADRCASRIHHELSTGVLVSLGGDIATAGAGPDGGWLVRVQERPGVDAGPANTVVLADGFAVATSSTVSRAWQRGGSRLHHILDPATRRPADPVWRTVTVAAPTCVAANAASTASIVRGHAAPGWLASRNVAARLVDERGVVRTIGSWPSERAAS